MTRRHDGAHAARQSDTCRELTATGCARADSGIGPPPRDIDRKGHYVSLETIVIVVVIVLIVLAVLGFFGRGRLRG